jgi:hypothetical protein
MRDLMRATFAWLTLCAALCAAPAPFRRAEKPPLLPQIEPGAHLMRWGGCDYHLRLWGDGTYRAQHDAGFSEIWNGTWNYDRGSRVLKVSETSAGSGTTLVWQARLDDKLSGETEPSAIPVAFVRR